MKTSWLSFLAACFTITGITAQQKETSLLPVSSSKENLGVAVNSEFTETKPLISADGKTLYFCRQNYPKNIRGKQDAQDIYVTELIDGKWSNAYNIGWPLNDQHPNGICSVSPDGNSILLINEYINGGYTKPGVSISHRSAGTWSFPEKLEIEDFYNFSPYVDYFMSADGKVLLMSVQRREGYGDQDLFVSFHQQQKWQQPVNLGPVVNTAGADFAPFLAADGKTLYFASEGHPGLGGSDIFYSKRLDDSWKSWSKPINLGPAVNTKTWDAYYSISAKGDYAYFVSREEEHGSKDIYRIELPDRLRPDPVVMVKGKVLNADTGEPLSASVKLWDRNGSLIRGTAHSDPESGTYRMLVPKGGAYIFQAEIQGYLSLTTSINLSEGNQYAELEQDLYVVPMVEGQKIPINNIFFVRSAAQLLPQSYQELDRLVVILNQHPTLKIELGGHTDNLGQASLNLDLSLQRVDAVKEYLVANGIDSSRLLTKGYGDTQPVARNDRELDRRRNRRVEFTILSL